MSSNVLNARAWNACMCLVVRLSLSALSSSTWRIDAPSSSSGRRHRCRCRLGWQTHTHFVAVMISKIVGADSTHRPALSSAMRVHKSRKYVLLDYVSINHASQQQETTQHVIFIFFSAYRANMRKFVWTHQSRRPPPSPSTRVRARTA